MTSDEWAKAANICMFALQHFLKKGEPCQRFEIGRAKMSTKENSVTFAFAGWTDDLATLSMDDLVSLGTGSGAYRAVESGGIDFDSVIETDEAALVGYIKFSLSMWGNGEFPQDWHHRAARQAVGDDKEDRAQLAEDIHQRMCEFVDGLEWPEKPLDVERDGVWWLDRELLELLASIGWREEDRSKVETTMRERWSERANTPIQDAHRLWYSPAAASGLFAVWPEIVANALNSTRAYRPRGVRAISGDTYTKTPKHASASSWAIGTTNNSYRAVDGATVLEAQSAFGITPRVPSQMLIPLSVQEEATMLEQGVGDAGALFSPVEGKVWLWLMIATSENSRMLDTTLGEFTISVNQDKTRPKQKRERERIRRALAKLRQAGYVSPLTGSHVPFFEVVVPTTLDIEAHVSFGRSSTFTRELRHMKTIADLTGNAKKLKGEVLLNVDGAMRISGNDHDALRTYLHAASIFNDARQRAEYCRWQTLEEWAKHTNSLSPQAVAHLKEEGRHRRKLSRDRKGMKAALEKVAEEYNLAELDVRGRGVNSEYRLSPTEEHVEAYHHHRKHGARNLDE